MYTQTEAPEQYEFKLEESRKIYQEAWQVILTRGGIIECRPAVTPLNEEEAQGKKPIRYRAINI